MRRLTLRGKYALLALSLVIPALVLAASCAKAPSRIKIAVVGPMTGSQAELGRDEANGVRIAVEEANARGGVLGKKIELVVMDDKADPKEGVSAANKMAADRGILGVIGHVNSGTTIPASSVYHRAGLVMITPSATNPRVTQQGFKNVFRLCIVDTVQGPAMADFAVDKLKKKTFAVLHDKTAYGQGVAEMFRDRIIQKGKQVQVFEGITQGDTDFSAVLTRIGGLKPEALYFGGMFPEAGLIAKQAHQLGLGATIMGADGLYTPDFMKIGGPGTEGAYMSFLAPPWESEPQAAKFVKTFNERYGDIKNYAPIAYDAAWILIKAIEKAGKPNRKAIIAVLRDPGFRHTGITGEARFDNKGDVIGRVPYIYVVRKGKLALIQ